MRKFIPFSDDTSYAPYVPFPEFIQHEEFSFTTKLIYCFMLNRATSSRKNENFRDKNGIFILASIDEICTYVRRKKTVVTKSINLLVETGYIKKKRMGQGISNKYYVYIPVDSRKNEPLDNRKSEHLDDHKTALPNKQTTEKANI